MSEPSSSRRRQQPPKRPEDRYRMRRLTDDEMVYLCRLARQGREGPARALEALWDLILNEAEGIGVAEAAARPGSYRVQDYAIASDQAETLKDAMVRHRRLPPRALNSIWLQWVDQSPCDYEDE